MHKILDGIHERNKPLGKLRRSWKNNTKLYISIVKQLDTPMYRIILFWNDTLRVSDGLSVHHQEFKTVHTATGVCQTDTATAC